jgi:amidase
MDNDLSQLDATAQAGLVRTKDATPLELVDAAIARIEKLNGDLNAVIHPLFDRARAAAQSNALPDGPFRGVPIVVKDLDGELAGTPYHAGNKLLKARNNVSTFTSYLFAKLEAAGFVIVGKTNTPEFGLMTTTEPEAYGPARNPWNTARSTGGSSGGSGAAVASGMVPLAHAGDGGGSIRIPATHCGLFGLKPSRGRISLGPKVAEDWAGLVMRHVLTHTVRDSAATLDALQGYMTGDWYTAPPPARPYASEVGAEPGALRIGVRTTAPMNIVEVDTECVTAVDNAATLLASLGHKVEQASPAAFDEGVLLEVFTAVMGTAVRAELEAMGVEFGRPITADDVEAGTWETYEGAGAITGAQYLQAITNMHAWTRRIASWWEDDGYDLLLIPTCGEPAPEIGDLTRPDAGVARQLPFAIFTAPFNISGQPAMSVPLHTTANGLPVGVQLVAAPYREDVLFRVAAQLERAQPWIDRVPPVHA